MESKDVERRFRGGEVIIERGSSARELFIVHEGTVLLEEARGGPARLLGPGELFGEVAPILDRPHAVRAVAEGDVVVLGLGVGLLNRLCAQSPEFAVRLIRQLAGGGEREPTPPEIADSAADQMDAEPPSARLEEGASSTAPGPVPESMRSFAGALLRRAEGDEAPLAVRERLADLARHAGLEILQAYTCLQPLLDRHVLRLVDDQLDILQPDELRDLAG